MIQIKHPIPFPVGYDLTRIGPPETLLFFDIETTGFSADTALVYLIGCVWYQEGSWNLAQWFADSKEAEKEILAAFFSWAGKFSTLVHFNGDTFDIPFLEKRCARLKLPYSLNGLNSVDIYRKIRPLKKLLGLCSLKQKAVEAFLGVDRKDVCSGGELIEVYNEYLHTHDEGLLKLLLLHNEDDLKGMPSILPILCYKDLMEGPLKLSGCQLQEDAALLHLKYRTPMALPASFQAQSDWLKCQAAGGLLDLQITLYHGELKYFYPNYKDYYYLPYEDTAIHRSVGEYVVPDARIRATAKNCYTKTTGLFLPQFSPLWNPALKRDYKDPLSFVSWHPSLFLDQEKASDYGLQALEYLQLQK